MHRNINTKNEVFYLSFDSSIGQALFQIKIVKNGFPGSFYLTAGVPAGIILSPQCFKEGI